MSIQNQSTNIINQIGISALVDCDLDDSSHNVLLQFLFNNKTGCKIRYQVILNGAGEPTVFDIPEVFDNDHLVGLAAHLSSVVASCYPTLSKEKQRQLEQQIFTFAEYGLTSYAGLGYFLGNSEMADIGIVLINMQRFSHKDIIRARVIYSGRSIKELNSRELWQFLVRHPKAIVMGLPSDINYLEQAIAHPNNNKGYNLESNAHDDKYHLMTNAHRLAYKLRQNKSSKVRFKKSGLAVVYRQGAMQKLPPVYV